MIMLTRSWLFVPGNNKKVLQKAETLNADVIIYDLEDAVAPTDKDEARRKAIEALRSSGKKIFIRVNSLHTSYFIDDIQYILENYENALKGIVLPKTSESSQIQITEYLLKIYETKYGIEEPLEIVPLIEDASGVEFCYEIANASNRINQLAFGAVDYSLDVNINPSENGMELLYARTKIANASRAAGISQPIDTVYVNFHNSQGLQDETNTAKSLGYGGKLVIHPNQIQIVNECFAPTEQEFQEAKKILEIVEQTGQSVFQLNGKMVDEPIIKKAQITIGKSNLVSQ